MNKFPFEIEGIVEVIITTFDTLAGWNVALLGLQGGERITARTWGKTKTRENFHKGGDAYIHFTRDSFLFVEAALCIKEQKTPHIEEAYAWGKIKVNSIDKGKDGKTEWEDWSIEIIEEEIIKKEIPIINRGYNAIIEATVVASRLRISDNRSKDLEYIGKLLEIVERCGDDRDREAKNLIEELVFGVCEKDGQRKKF